MRTMKWIAVALLLVVGCGVERECKDEAWPENRAIEVHSEGLRMECRHPEHALESASGRWVCRCPKGGTDR